MSAQKPRRAGASGDLLASGVKPKGNANIERESAEPGGLAARSQKVFSVVGRHNRERRVLMYDCGCGATHEARVRPGEREFVRQAPCGGRITFRVPAVAR